MRPAGARSAVEVRNPPGSGKEIAKGKGVVGDDKSEGSWRRSSGLTNRNHIRLLTKDGFKDRQLHMEDYLQIIPAEQGRYAEVSVYQRITENNDIITDFSTDNLLELILRKENLNKAYKKVKANKGKGRINGMQVDDFCPT